MGPGKNRIMLLFLLVYTFITKHRLESSQLSRLLNCYDPIFPLGWRPARSIKFCSWGGEEAGGLGSTEFVDVGKNHTFVTFAYSQFLTSFAIQHVQPQVDGRLKIELEEVLYSMVGEQRQILYQPIKTSDTL